MIYNSLCFRCSKPCKKNLPYTSCCVDYDGDNSYCTNTEYKETYDTDSICAKIVYTDEHVIVDPVTTPKQYGMKMIGRKKKKK